MSQIDAERRTFLAVFSAAPMLGLSACGGGQAAGEAQAPRPTGSGSIRVTLLPDRLAPGQSVQATSLRLDADGTVSGDQSVAWTSSNPAVATVTAQGRVSAVAPGQAQINAASGALSGTGVLTVIAVAQPGEMTLVGQMYAELPDFITRSIASTRRDLMYNPLLTAYLQAQIDKLTAPGLAEGIVARGQVLFRALPSLAGSLPAALVYMAPEMRPRAERMLNLLAAVLPLAEDFFGLPYPPGRMKVWYGFAIGSDSTIAIEDEALYAARPPDTKQPYDGVAPHELAHAFMPHETLNQFLELLFINQLLTGETALDRWTIKRGYIASRPDNQQIHALLDIYGLIGLDAMRTAYRRIYPLRPPFAQPLGLDAQQVLVDAAPAATQERVRALAARIGS